MCLWPGTRTHWRVRRAVVGRCWMSPGRSSKRRRRRQRGGHVVSAPGRAGTGAVATVQPRPAGLPVRGGGSRHDAPGRMRRGWLPARDGVLTLIGGRVQLIAEPVLPGSDDHGTAVPDPAATLAGVAVGLVRCYHIKSKPDPRSGFTLSGFAGLGGCVVNRQTGIGVVFHHGSSAVGSRDGPRPPNRTVRLGSSSCLSRPTATDRRARANALHPRREADV